jgi:hypothetical protein
MGIFLQDSHWIQIHMGIFPQDSHWILTGKICVKGS